MFDLRRSAYPIFHLFAAALNRERGLFQILEIQGKDKLTFCTFGTDQKLLYLGVVGAALIIYVSNLRNRRD